MTCLACNSPATEIGREIIPAKVYPTEYEITTESRVSVAYQCDNCHLKFWVYEKP